MKRSANFEVESAWVSLFYIIYQFLKKKKLQKKFLPRLNTTQFSCLSVSIENEPLQLAAPKLLKK